MFGCVMISIRRIEKDSYWTTWPLSTVIGQHDHSQQLLDNMATLNSYWTTWPLSTD